MKFDNKAIFVTGANRGIGKAIVDALLKQKVKKIYAAARDLEQLKFSDARLVPVKLDITDRRQIQKAVEQAQDVDVLINNAGVLSFAPIVGGNADELARDMNVNYFGTVNTIRSFVPVLEKRGEAAIACVSSIAGLVSLASIGGYSASKAALFSAIQAMRAELKPKHISVHGIYPGPIDTDMTKGFDMQKTSPQATAENIVKGILAGEDYIFPDPMSAEWGAMWAKNPKELEKQFAERSLTNNS
jgi:NAD(P)-dependent dehydrogenase (short-subunit alcohol dehydrogenase family)